jgi:hypothetical protein
VRLRGRVRSILEESFVIQSHTTQSPRDRVTIEYIMLVGIL